MSYDNRWQDDNDGGYNRGGYNNGKLQPSIKNNVRFWQLTSAVLVIVVFISLSYSLVLRLQIIQQVTTKASTPTTKTTQQTLQGSSPVVTSTSVAVIPTAPMPTPTPTPAPIVKVGTICQANSSQGWSGWGGSPDWKTLNNVLLNDGTHDMSDSPTIVAPCLLQGIADYEVEVKIRVLRNNPCFGIYIRGTTTAQGWQGYVAIVCYGTAYIATSWSYPNSNTIVGIHFDAGYTTHTYIFAAKGNDLKLFIDGAPLLEGTDNRYLSGDQVGLCAGAQLEVSSYKVTTL